VARAVAVLAAIASLAAVVIEPEPPVDALASVMCAECKRCTTGERAAVAHVAISRATWAASWWGSGLVEVLRWPGQFAAPAPACRWELPPRADGLPWSPGFVAWHRERLAAIHFEADQILAGEVANPTPGATHFHTVALGQVWPWLIEIPPPRHTAPGAWFHRFYLDKSLRRQ